jgi:hypothetical protein
MPLAPVKSLLRDTSSQVRTFPLLMIGVSTPSTRAFTTERSAAPCRRRRADGWRACRARNVAPEAWRLLASVSVDDTGLQRRNLAETGTLRECERDETTQHQRRKLSQIPSGGAYQCLERGASLFFRASMPRNVPLEQYPADIRGLDLHRFAYPSVITVSLNERTNEWIWLH